MKGGYRKGEKLRMEKGRGGRHEMRGGGRTNGST